VSLGYRVPTLPGRVPGRGGAGLHRGHGISQGKDLTGSGFEIRFVRLFKPEEHSKSQLEWTYKIFFTHQYF
jgi:hypothetical protein